MKYVCRVCGYVYDDAREKVPFETLPADWRCPLCGAAKTDFAPEGENSSAAAAPIVPAAAPEAELKELSAGQLAALCSNLARGCEKQYLTEESGLFRRLADYFTAIAPAVEDSGVEEVAKLLRGDVELYPSVAAAAGAAADRGAARVCVWGEKVTRMLSSLVDRYLREGETMLEGTSVWLCTTCGFVYIGKNPPEMCPVCKVPAWKFEKIEGRDGE